MEKNGLDGMTVNERLFEIGLLDSFDEAVKAKDESKIRKILQQAQLSDESVDAIITKSLQPSEPS